MDIFLPNLAYWVAEDGRIFSGPAQSLVTSTDTAYEAFIASGHQPRSWPRDAQGVQTTASLQDVLTPYGMFADLVGYAANARYNKEVSGITVSGMPVATDDRSKQMIMGARIAAVADSTFTTPWVGSDGSITTLNATQVIAVSNAVLAHVQACFSTFATLKNGISATPPTVTTRAAVDAAFAAITA